MSQRKSKKEKKNKRPRGKNAFADSVLKVFANNPFKTYNYKQVASSLGISDKASKDLVNTILVELLEDGALREVKPGKYKLSEEFITETASSKKYITGRVDMKGTGKAYIINDEGGEDIFISANNTSRALHGDKVKVFLFPKRQGRKTEGQIVEILQRAKEQYVGIIEVSKHFAFLIADKSNMPVDIFIPAENLKGAKNGQKVIVKLTDWPEHSKNPFGTVVEVLGEPGDNNVEMKSILAEYDFPLSFPKSVLKEAENIKPGITPAEISSRKDYRNVFTITIDPADAKDFDDALSLKKLENGNWEVGNHISPMYHSMFP